MIKLETDYSTVRMDNGGMKWVLFEIQADNLW